MDKHQPIVLVIIDGYGLTPSWGGNAITMGNPKTLNYLWKHFPHLVLNSFKKIAGSYRMVGNSVIGHSSIGAGRIVFQDLERISQSIKNKTFYQNEKLIATMRHANDYNAALHIIGLLSDGGIHGHIDHIKALLLMAKSYQLPRVYVHAILDGIDTDARSGIDFVRSLENFISQNKIGQIATIIGRDFAMDRDNNWNNIKLTVQSLVGAQSKSAKSAAEAIAHYYQNNIPDNSIPPTVIINENIGISRIRENDAVILTNYRSDRAQEITIGILGYHPFRRIKIPKHLFFTAFSSYYLPEAIEKNINIAFTQERIDSTLGKIISKNNLKQFRIAESEKKPHITTFFDCGSNEILPGEERVIIESFPKSNYLNNPKMRASEITDKLIEVIKSQRFNFILANYANVDVLAHTGDIAATAKAVEFVDQEIRRLYEITNYVDGTLIITADHGNAEQMVEITSIGDRETFHTLNPVPFIFVRNDLERTTPYIDSDELLSKLVITNHSLADIAPTILDLFGLDIPNEMTGQSLLKYILRSKNERGKVPS